MDKSMKHASKRVMGLLLAILLLAIMTKQPLAAQPGCSGSHLRHEESCHSKLVSKSQGLEDRPLSGGIIVNFADSHEIIGVNQPQGLKDITLPERIIVNFADSHEIFALSAPSFDPPVTVTPSPTATSTPITGSSPTATSTPVTGSSPTSTPTTGPLPTVTAEIDPDNGGTLTSPQGDVQLDFPAGAVTTNTTVTYSELTAPTQDLGTFGFAGTSFQIEATDANGEPVTTFNNPFTIRVEYNDADWQQAGITSEQDLNLAYWDGSQWVTLLPCEGCTLDTGANVLTAVLNHLTEFALLGETNRLFLPLVIR